MTDRSSRYVLHWPAVGIENGEPVRPTNLSRSELLVAGVAARLLQVVLLVALGVVVTVGVVATGNVTAGTAAVIGGGLAVLTNGLLGEVFAPPVELAAVAVTAAVVVSAVRLRTDRRLPRLRAVIEQLRTAGVAAAMLASR